MKGKIRFLILLLMFLVFLPTNIFAEDKIVEAKDISSETVSLDKDQVSKDQQNAVKESERKDPENAVQKPVENSENDLNSKNQTETNQDQESVKESENLLVKEDKEADTKDPEKQETTLEDDSQDDESAGLEISDLQKAEAVKASGGGGSSGGGSGCFSSGGGGFSGGSSGPFPSGGLSFHIQKVDENGKPMKVAFKITNLGNGEPHIVMTDENGISRPIALAELKKYEKENFTIVEEDTSEEYLDKHHFTFDEINNFIEDLENKPEEKDDFSKKDLGKPNLFPEKENKNPDNVNQSSSTESDIGNPDIKGPKVDVEAPDVNIEGPDVNIKGPDVNVEAPDVNVEGPDVNVKGPDVNVEAPDVNVKGPDVNVEASDVNVKGPDVNVEAPDVDVEVPNQPKLPDPNKNDKFLTENKFYKYEDLEKDTFVKFSDIEIKGKVTLHIEYMGISNSSNKNLVEEFIYEGITIDQVNKLNKETLDPIIKEYVKKKISQICINENIDTKDSKDDKLFYKYSLEYTNDYGGKDKNLYNTYKVEELRTDTNKNYSLKTFYVQLRDEKSEDGKISKQIFMGDSLKGINQKPDAYLSFTEGGSPQITPYLPAPQVYSQNSDGLEISGANISVPVRGGGGSSVGSSGSGKGVALGTPLFTIVNEKFKFETFASDSTNKDEKVLEQGDRTQVTDRISFDKLSVGKEYKFVGKLINKRTGEEVKTENPIVYETGKLTNPNGEASITITFDSSIYQDGDEFVLVYDIFEDGKLAGFEDKHDNPDQSFKIVSTTTPPGRDYPTPEEETPPPKEETPPPKEETPPPKEEVPTVEEVEKESPKQVVEVTKPTPVYMAPKTYDPGIGLNVFTAILSGAALTFLRKRR